MAEALLEAVVENLGSLVQKEFATLFGVNREIGKLSNALTLIKAVLEDAEAKQITNPSIRVWLQQLKDAVHVLDDILEECSIKSCRLKGSSSFKPKNLMFRRKVGNRLKQIRERFDQIAEDRKNFLLCEVGGIKERPIEVPEWRQTSSLIPQPEVYGRGEDKEKIVDFLLGKAQGSDFLSVYPIVGLGGVGKTTLAQLVYNDDQVSSHFNLKIWVCVSEDFNVKGILCSVIESISGEKYNLSDLDPMQKKVQELLQSKRYLLVLDDVWNRNQDLEFGLTQDKWDKLKSGLTCGSKGTSILVSTRDMDVAKIMGTCPAHQLSGLSEDDCWLLFKQRAFGPGNEERAELVPIGREIVRKCGGSPLAAKALGGLLRCKSEENEWLEVRESKLWTLPDDSILPALRLSYLNLTPTLRQCFAFCAIFPKDKVIRKELLIHLWMANGFISSRENLDVEDVGNAIWNELYHKSFFQDIKTSDFGDIVSFKMHDLVHDLAQSIMGQECLALEGANMTKLSRSTHHVGCTGFLESVSEEAFKKVESLRTLFSFDKCFIRISGSFQTICSLRVLCTYSFELSSLGKLIHLRYLELSRFDIRTLPDSIYSLQKLEILKLKSLYKLCHLSEHLTRLQNLRHLEITRCSSLSRTLPNVRKLSCLRTLSVYIVSLETGHSLAELSDLKLGGTLSIEGLENVGNLSEAKGANLVAKKDLQHLRLSWGCGREAMSDATKAEQVLEALQPHSNLKSLTIYQYEALHLPSWMRNNSVLCSLSVLQLNDIKNCRQLSSLGKLPSLRRLEIYGMEHVQYMDDDESYDGVEVRAFTSLESLQVTSLPNLERLLKVERGEMFPRLSKLEIHDCPKLQLPCLPSVKTLHVGGCTNELLMSVSSLCGLTSLSLIGCEDLASFPEGMMRNLTSLKDFEIRGFKRLKELPYELMSLNTLEYLQISDCHELESFAEQVLEGLLSLRTLCICRCQGLRSLSEGVRHLTSLELLYIGTCIKLESLPYLEGLVSLRTLRISCCQGLRSLPEGVRHLTSLELLHIEKCPTLGERCKEGSGEDWHKIAHIPKVRVQ